jgi:hypothetical protein
MGLFAGIWNGISSLFSTCTSIVGAWIPATAAIIKTDINVFWQIFSFLIMFITSLATLSGICWIIVSAYNQLVYSISFGIHPFWTSVAGCFAMVLLVYLFHPIINFIIRLIGLAPAAILYICGHQEGSVAYYNAIMDRKQQRAITN